MKWKSRFLNLQNLFVWKVIEFKSKHTFNKQTFHYGRRSFLAFSGTGLLLWGGLLGGLLGDLLWGGLLDGFLGDLWGGSLDGFLGGCISKRGKCYNQMNVQRIKYYLNNRATHYNHPEKFEVGLTNLPAWWWSVMGGGIPWGCGPSCHTTGWLPDLDVWSPTLQVLVDCPTIIVNTNFLLTSFWHL